jgi:hypothetical protein
MTLASTVLKSMMFMVVFPLSVLGHTMFAARFARVRVKGARSARPLGRSLDAHEPQAAFGFLSFLRLTASRFFPLWLRLDLPERGSPDGRDALIRIMRGSGSLPFRQARSALSRQAGRDGPNSSPKPQRTNGEGPTASLTC